MQATDKGMPRFSGTTVIKIQVTDVNDNAPTFLPSEAVEMAESKCGDLKQWFALTCIISSTIFSARLCVKYEYQSSVATQYK